MLGDVLLAWEMNGQPLPPEHGFPLRIVAPGWIGARSVKWLSSIHVQQEPSDNYYQQRTYKVFPPHVDKSSADWSQGLSRRAVADVGDLRSARRRRGRRGARTGPRLCQSGGQRTVERVEVSADNGGRWEVAELSEATPAGAWRLWEATLELRG